MKEGETLMGHFDDKGCIQELGGADQLVYPGAPSETLYQILQVLYTEKAKWVARLPVRPFTLKRAAKVWGTTEAKAEKLLNHLCEKALLVDSDWRAPVCHAASDGRLHRVCADAYQRRY